MALKSAKELAKKIAEIASDRKAEDILILDLKQLTSFTEFFVICSGKSERQVQAIAEAVKVELKKDERVPLGQEGASGGRWVLIDYGDAILHVFYHAEREYYGLEDLWHDAPRVSVKGVTS